MSKSTAMILLKVTAVLWLVWGLVHAIAGIIVLSSDASAGFAAISDAVEPSLLAYDYHPAVGAILNQHAWNLLWGGLVTMIGGVFIWKANITAIWVTAMIGGLLDLGYFMFLDLGGFVHFMPGTFMTLVSSAAIILSFAAWKLGLQSSKQ